MSLTANSTKNDASAVHLLHQNTDFANIWYEKNGCSRYYHSNNLLKEWKNHNYENSSFKIQGKPGIFSFFGVTYIKWPLLYKSTMVFPIRYKHEGSQTPKNEADTLIEENCPRVWGFLCIDSASLRAFKLPYAAEVGGAFADSLYMLFTYSAEKRKDSQ